MAISPFAREHIVVVTNKLQAVSSDHVNAVRMPRVYSSIRRVRAGKCTLSRRPVRLLNETFVISYQVTLSPRVRPNQVGFHRGVQATQVVFVSSLGSVFTRRSIRYQRYAISISNLGLPTAITDG